MKDVLNLKTICMKNAAVFSVRTAFVTINVNYALETVNSVKS